MYKVDYYDDLEYESGEDYWRREHNYGYNYVTKSKNDKYFDVGLFPENTEPEVGDDVYLVVVQHDDGDSFGTERNCEIMLWLFTDKKMAYELVDWIEEDNKLYPDSVYNNPRKFKDVPISTYRWKGYFEHFKHADVQHLILKKDRSE